MNIVDRLLHKKKKRIRTKDEENIIGNEIKELRHRKGLSQKDLAKELSITRQAISDWERGFSKPSLETLNKLRKIYDIDINNFFIEGVEEVEVQSRTSCEDLIGNLNKEIKRLNKCYCERTDCAGRIKNSAKFDSVQEENERLNNIIKKLERLVDDYSWNCYYLKCGNRYLKSEILNDIREIIELKGSDKK